MIATRRTTLIQQTIYVFQLFILNILEGKINAKKEIGRLTHTILPET